MSCPRFRPSAPNHRAHTDRLLAFLQVARAASARALQHAQGQRVHELLQRAHEELVVAHALVRASQGDRAE